MHRRLALAAVAALTVPATVALLTEVASATDVNVSYGQECVPGAAYWNATVDLASAWDGTSHIQVVSDTMGTRTLTVAPHGTASTTFQVATATLHVSLADAAGDHSILHGELSHTFVQPVGCTVTTSTEATTTTTEATTTTTSSVPPPPTTPPNVGSLQVVPPVRVPEAPAVPESSPAPEEPTTMVRTSAPALPATGDDPTVPLTLAVLLLVSGAALVLRFRRAQA